LLGINQVQPLHREKKVMHTLQQSYRGFSLMIELNWDRLLYLATIAFALAAGAWLGSL
jgi:hypothetical protein